MIRLVDSCDDATGVHRAPRLMAVRGDAGPMESKMPVPDDSPTSVPPPPVTGAWVPGDAVGQRRFFTIADDRPFVLECGASLRAVTMAYETWGTLSAAADNAVLVCHALTGDSHAAGRQERGHSAEGWWNDFIGSGLAIDTDTHFVVCVNVLGGCQGSTGPSSIDPSTGRPYGSAFPAVTIRDMVRAQARVADHLGIGVWRAVIGGSMGGMQVLEWAAMFPNRVRAIAPLATTLAASAQQIAWSAVGRRSITLDPAFAGGDYYDAAPGGGPHRGLALARSIAHIHYRSDHSYDERFGRSLASPDQLFGRDDEFQVERYLDYQGDKLVRRFDANSYLLLNKAMDTHDLARGRGSMAAAVRRIRVPVATVSISSDFLYPPHQQAQIHAMVTAQGGDCTYEVVDDPRGHDAFLLAADRVAPLVADLLAKVTP